VTLTWGQILPYAGALAVLAATPGPVVAALIARSATGGVRAAVPLAAGVAVGDVIWPLLAMLGIGVVAGVWASFLLVLRYVGAAILVLMGVQLIRRAEAAGLAVAGGGLGRESGWAAFSAGLMVIAGNPKAILFYMGVLPGFFDLTVLTVADIVAVCLISALVPFLGNLAWAALFARARAFLADPEAMRRTHVGAGLALIAVGAAIAVG
jgi:threonine/homoserine/homoserine lactone efflux protein